MQNPRTGDQSNLDFLRAVAVTLVLCDHVLAKFHVDKLGTVVTNHIGHFGVLLFFVHTSLVLMYSLERSRMTGTRLFGNFYLRRIFRIYLLSIVAVCITIALGLSSTAGHGLVTSPSPSWGQAASNLFLVQNLTRSDSILGPLWSLPLELQMYALLPLLFLLTIPLLLYHLIDHPMIQLGGALARVPSPRTAATEAPVATIVSNIRRRLANTCP